MAFDFTVTDNQISFAGISFNIPKNIGEQGQRILLFASDIFKGYVKDIKKITESIESNIKTYWNYVIVNIRDNIEKFDEEKVEKIFNNIFSKTCENVIENTLDSIRATLGDRDDWTTAIVKKTTDYLFDRRKESICGTIVSNISSFFFTDDAVRFENELFFVFREVICIDLKDAKHFAHNEIQDATSLKLKEYFKKFRFFKGPRDEYINFEQKYEMSLDIANAMIEIELLPISVKLAVIKRLKKLKVEDRSSKLIKNQYLNKESQDSIEQFEKDDNEWTKNAFEFLTLENLEKNIRLQNKDGENQMTSVQFSEYIKNNKAEQEWIQTIASLNEGNEDNFEEELQNQFQNIVDHKSVDEKEKQLENLEKTTSLQNKDKENQTNRIEFSESEYIKNNESEENWIQLRNYLNYGDKDHKYDEELDNLIDQPWQNVVDEKPFDKKETQVAAKKLEEDLKNQTKQGIVGFFKKKFYSECTNIIQGYSKPIPIFSKMYGGGKIILRNIIVLPPSAEEFIEMARAKQRETNKDCKN